MFTYTVRCTISDPQQTRRWLDWLEGGHIADVMAGGAVSAQIVKIDAPGPEEIYEVRYSFPDREAFKRYERDFAPTLREEGLRLFPADQFAYSRTTGEEIMKF